MRTITAPTIAIFSGISKHEADPNKRGQESWAEGSPKGRKQVGEAVNRKTTKKYPGGELRPQEKAAREGQLFLV